MTAYETELKAAFGFLEDQLDDVRMLLRSTPTTELGGERCQELLDHAADVMSDALVAVITYKVMAEPRGN